MEGLNSNLNLNAGVSPRVMPTIGEWGGEGIPTTRTKRRQRWWTIAAAVGVLVAVVAFGTLVYFQLRG